MENTIFIKGFKQYPKNYEVVVSIGEDCPDSQKGLITVLRASTKQEAEEAAFYGVKFADGMTIKVAGRAYTLNRWTKYDNDRIYVNREDGNKEGFIDLKWHKDRLAQGRRLDYHKRMAEMILSMQF